MNKFSFNGAIGAWIDSELHPTGATKPDSPNSNFTSMRLNSVYKSLDYLCIAWYDVDMTNPKQPTISTSNPGLQMIVADARSQNPDIKLFATLAYSNQILTDLQTIIDDPTLLKAFATNIATYLDNNHMDGFDIDWEFPVSNMTQKQCAAWLTALGQAFGDTRFISISPAVTSSLDANAVNSNCDIINLQSYSGFTSPADFVSIGIDPALLGFGAKFETSGGGNPNPYENAYQAYKKYIAGFTAKGTHYPYKTTCTWRLDSDNWSFEQGQQLLYRQYIKGSPDSVPFNDGEIINAQTTPTLMHTVSVRTGDVVDAIQTSNQNHNGSYVVEMLEHGGITVPTQATISLPNGLTHFSYVTGDWYGNHVIVQIAINGTNYPRSISPAVSGTHTTNVSAPAGKSIVAFRGSTQKVQLAGGGYTWVLSSIEPVFG